MKLINFFMPKIDSETKLETESLLYQLRAKVLIGLSLFLLLVISSLIILEIITTTPNVRLYIIGLMIVISLGLSLFFIRKGKLNISIALFTFLFTVIFLFRTHLTGGYLSPAIGFIFPLSILLNLFFENKFKYIVLLYGVFYFTVFHLSNSPTSEIAAPLRGLFYISSLTLLAMVLYTIKDYNSLLTSLAQKYEKDKVLETNVVELSHNLNKPLTIALANLEHLNVEKDKENYDVIQEQLYRIKKVLLQIQELQDSEKLKYEAYSHGLDIIQVEQSFRNRK